MNAEEQRVHDNAMDLVCKQDEAIERLKRLHTDAFHEAERWKEREAEVRAYAVSATEALREIAEVVTRPIYDAAGGVMDTDEEPALDRHTMARIARAALAKNPTINAEQTAPKGQAREMEESGSHDPARHPHSEFETGPNTARPVPCAERDEMCWRRSCRAQDTCVEREMRERDSRHQSGKKPYVLSEAEQAVMSKALMRSVTVVDSGHQVRNHEEAERADYRRALEDIIAKSDDPSAIAIAHAAITPWTPWVAVDEGRARAIQRAALPARYCPKCGAGGDKAGQAGSECWTPGCDGVIASRSYESVACTKQEGR